ncbi:unnamed protein product [Bodo saltans]|uniref:Uncharacterized protein n=1 Tax=Bodo saltans TaxID=75058 RepID=A0A0S4J411_BODSA|nr:unnamed protein product [Bodo saltans]|eukprot:CUG85995.1 unnamed protein product [Bodo saltans]
MCSNLSKPSNGLVSLWIWESSIGASVTAFGDESLSAPPAARPARTSAVRACTCHFFSSVFAVSMRHDSGLIRSSVSMNCTTRSIIGPLSICRFSSRASSSSAPQHMKCE